MAKIFRTSPDDRDDKKFRPQSRHYNDLMNRVRDYIKTTDKHCVRKEEVAEMFKAKPHEIEQCFHKLNLEGLLSQASKIEPHDYSRKAGDSCWAADIYYIQNNQEKEEIKGRLILSSVNDVSMLNKDIIKLFIARVPMPRMDKMGWKWASKLAPSNDLLYSFKKGLINWEQYYSRYMKEVIYNPACVDALNTIYNHLKAGEDITLICYCNDENICHRSILGKYYNKLGVNIISLKGNKHLNTFSKINLMAGGLLNTEATNTFIEEFLDSKYNLRFLIENPYLRGPEKIISYTNSQLKTIANKIYEFQDVESAKIMLKNYTVPEEIKAKLESVIVMGGLI
jgi:uncharacterized protein YeaO (DUF488 family)